MKNKHYNFRVLGEARLCRMSSEVAGDTPTSNNEQIGEALLPPDGDGSSQGMQDGAKTQMDVRSGNLGKVLEDMGETADASQKTPVDTVPPAGEVKNAPEAKARKPRGNAEMRAKIRAEAAQDAAVAAKEEAAKPEAPAPEAPAPVGPADDSAEKGVTDDQMAQGGEEPQPEAPAPEAPAPVGPADDSAEKGVTDDQMAQGGEEPQPEAPAPEAPAPVGPADDSAEKKVTDDQMAEGGRADPPENRQVIMAEMQGKTEQLLQAVRDAEAKAEMEGYTPENTQAITAAIDAYITAANSEQGYLRADDLVTNVDRQSTLDTEIAQQRNRREQLGNYPNESKAPNGQPEKGAESGEKTIDQLNTKINQSLDSAKEALSKLPNAKNSPVPETILTGRFEKVTGTQSGNRAREDIVLKCRATAGTLNLISKIGYDATSYNPATGSGDVRRGNQTIEISNHEVTIDLEELVCCDDMPLEEQVRHVEEALEEITTAFSTEADPKKTQQRFDAQVSSGSFITESFQEKPGEESWRTDARGTEELRQLFKDMPKDAQKTVIGRFMEKANVRQDKDGKTFLSTSANMATEFRAVALFAARSINIVERQDENGKPLEMGMQTSPSQISHLLNGIRLRYTQEGGKGEAEGSTSIDGHKISSSETDTPDNKATEVSGAAGGDKVEGAGEKTNDGGRKGVEASKELPPAIQEAKNHFGERYANLSPEKMKAVMAAIESLDPEQARVLMDSYKVLSPKEKEIYDKAGPKIVEELAQLSPNDIRIKIQMIAENDTGKLIKLNKSLSPEGKAVLDKNASQFSQEENDMYDKLHNEQDRLAVERGIVKPNAAPSVSADDQVPAGAPEAVRRVADLRTQMVDVNNKIGEVNQELAPLNGQLQQLKGERAALVAKNEDTADIDQKITQVEQQMKPLLDKRDALKAEAKDIAAQIKDSKGELPENATRADVARRALDDMGDAFKDPNATGGEKLIAAIQAIGAIMALWRSAMGRGEAQPAEVAGSKPTDKPKDNGASKPTDGSEQPTERGAETPEARKGRLRKEVKDSAVNSAQELIAEKKQTLEKQTKGLKDRIDALNGETKGLKGESEGLAKKIAEKK
ncbi:hypothetical protein FJZ27_00005, partial [Candidatus Peribacteria bacterium]|nr:hypothetical protein [Candidatus Peribacteria bacterium]